MFITLEGIDRSGKTTQAALLAEALGPDAVLLREPGGTPAGERIRELLKDPELQLGPGTELLLFNAARAELCREVVRPALDDGRDVVCDRFIDSTVAYQGVARELGTEVVEQLSELVVGSCLPDLTILFRIDPEVAAAREGDASDRFESEGLEFQRRVAGAYDELARRHPERIEVIEADGEPEEIHGRVMALVDARREAADLSPVAEVPEGIVAATADQPSARAALAAASAEPFHAYLLAGPPGSGKREAARALAAELLAEGAPDPADSRRRALADPSPHPDLVWLRPPGTQHLVDEVRERVIAQVAYRPFEGERRVFVIEAADAMAEESQNALLKTLEEPPPFAHLILVSDEPEALLDTVRSRCRVVRFGRLGTEAVEARLADHPAGAERTAAARLAAGDPERARFLLGDDGRALRAAAERLARAVREGDLAGAPWEGIATAAEAASEHRSAAVQTRAAEAEEEAADRSPAAVRRRAREAEDAARRAGRRARTETLDLGLALLGAWVRDLAAVADGAPELALNSDHADELAELAEGLDARRARRAGELVLDTRRRLQVNVSEALALEALAFRLEFLLGRR